MDSKCVIKSSLKEFENIDTEKLLIILNETYDEKLSLREQFRLYLDSRWYERYSYKYRKVKRNTAIAFYSDYYYRDDKLTVFQDFIKRFPAFDYVLPIKLPRRHRSFMRGVRMLMWDIYNMWLLRNSKNSLAKKIYLVRSLGLVHIYLYKMNQYLSLKKYSFGLVFSDTTPDEHALVLFMKKKNIYTATLQHGIFNKRGYWKGIEFRASVADDWLAWNQYSKELAMECGMQEDKIKVLGMPRYITPVHIERNGSIGVFSVVLNEQKMADENRELIKYANLLAEERGLKYFIRYHPNCKASEYEEFLDESVCIKKSRQGETIKQMCERSDFSLVGSGTSMAIDLIYLKQPFLQYNKEWTGDVYRERNNYFRNYRELKEQLVKELTSQSKEMFDYYCTTMDVKQAYDSYFQSFMSTRKK